ncbi:mitochondrial 54S ribosomal protein YmL35 [Coemansia sp. RSA 2167]|nr:mitochondrial 54S ribosomal protein YmL35 [Coemansia sp. RSA 1591]KAJ1792077.1 mitochondrial 54S ribosomal protein YmL35 [Coemansia sp. RSA 1938]KAJ1793261.1 mitochondrial 54S ribosomal protein YmL35 [Coemansia sp. RSA 2167]KAJ2438427.1 mitochondrial 54S ribosomal protein YmL35 [Coemansia sp. RSA 2440]
MHAITRTLRHRLFSTQRMALAVRHQSTYKQPATGVNPAYDEALEVIRAYSEQKAHEATLAHTELQKAQDAGADSSTLRALKKAWFDLRVESRINDGEVLWNARNGRFDLTEPVYEHLKQNEWQGRPLEILMQRLLQMFVLPDMLDPRFVGTPESQLNLQLARGVVEPGSVVDPSSAKERPGIELMTFHDEPRLHTIVMVDLDEPCEAEQTFREQFHWIVSNVSASKMQNTADLDKGTELLAYVPPHPAHGTPMHRYVVAVLEQPEDGQQRLDSAQVSRDMNMRDFVTEHSLRVVGLSFFRAEWNESVDDVYRDVLKQAAPRYGPITIPPKNVGPDGRMKYAYENR